MFIDFNPRSYKRSDENCKCSEYPLTISIHAPTRGATRISQKPERYWAFQSTLLQEERPRRIAGASGKYDFNPRSYKRSDDENLRNAQNVLDISIHAPTRGATIKSDLYIGKVRISIHAPTRGATSASKSSLISTIISIHAPTRGATSGIYLWSTVIIISIHAPTRGATEKAIGKEIQILFQSTLLQEERPWWAGCIMLYLWFQSTLLQEERR